MTGIGPHAPGRAHETPRRAREVDIQPAIAEGRSAGGEALAQPGIPRIGERVRDAAAEEIAVAWKLAVETYLHRRFTIRN